MADPASAVTDTHPLLFHAAGGRRLGPRARALFAAAEARDAIIYVPVVVILGGHAAGPRRAHQPAPARPRILR